MKLSRIVLTARNGSSISFDFFVNIVNVGSNSRNCSGVIEGLVLTHVLNRLSIGFKIPERLRFEDFSIQWKIVWLSARADAVLSAFSSIWASSFTQLLKMRGISSLRDWHCSSGILRIYESNSWINSDKLITPWECASSNSKLRISASSLIWCSLFR